MKRTQIKDIFRTIGARFVSWLSIVVIAALAVASFIGVRFSADAMRTNADRYYDNTGFRDIEVISTMLLTEEDLQQIAEVEGVGKVVGIRSFDTTLTNKGVGCDVTVATLSDEINAPKLISGSLPTGQDECLVESDIAEEIGLSAGDTIVIPQTSYLTRTTFRIAGIVSTPINLAVGDQVAGNRSVLLAPEVFSAEAFDDCYSKAEIALENVPDADMFSERYLSYVNGCRSRLEDLADGRTKLRQQELIERYQKEIDEKQALLDEAAAELADARSQLDENQALLKDAAEELASKLQELKDADKKLKNAKAALDKAWSQLSASKAELDSGAAQLASAKKQLESSYLKMLDVRDTYRNIFILFLSDSNPGRASEIEWVTSRKVNADDPNLSMKKVPLTKNFSMDLTKKPEPQVRAFLSGKDFTTQDLIEIYAWIKEIDPSEVTLSREELIETISDYICTEYLSDESTKFSRKQAKAWESSHAAYLSGRATYNAGLAEYNTNYASYERGLAEYRRGLASYRKGQADYDDGVQTYQKAEEELAQKEAEYDSSLAEFEDGKAQIAEAAEQLEKIPLSHWIVLNVRGNASYIFLESISSSFRSISSSFSLLLVFVAALVIYATIGKIIEEQRNLVGTTKALGFWNSEIFRKYLAFALTAAFAGYAIGIALAYFAIERVFLQSQSVFFHLSDIKLLFEPSFALLAAALTFLVCTAAVYLACRRLVRMPAIRLMQGEPPAGVKSGKHAGAAGALYPRLIVRNMRADLKRVTVTIVSIAGCCALILIGLTVSHSMSSALNIQFDRIYRYDYMIDFDPSEDGQTEAAIEDVLTEGGSEFISVYYGSVPFRNGDEIDSTFLLSGDPEQIAEFYETRDPLTGAGLDLSASGVFIPKKLNEKGNYLEAGSITLFGKDMEPFDVSISGVFDCYIARYLIMSEQACSEVFGSAQARNQYLIRTDAAGAEQMRAALEAIPGVKSFYASKDRMAQFEGSIGLANGIVVLLTIVSFIMAFFILLNLINMYLSQKKRELTVMRINGFTVGEVKAYVGREMIFTTGLGILFGIALGAVLGLRIIKLLESINSFNHQPYYIGWLIAAAGTALLSLMISMIALKKIKGLKLTDIA